MKTVRLSTAQAIVKFLANVYFDNGVTTEQFVTGFATIFGHGNVLGLGEALAYENHNFSLYQGKNEQAMAHVAIGYSKQLNRQKIIACTSSVGPGSANLVTAAATATANHLPLLVFCGDVYASRRPDPVLQQIEHFHDLTVSTNDAFKPVSKYFDRITRPEQLINSLIYAMQVLTDPSQTGAVVISLPQDVQAEVYDYPEWFFDKRVYALKRQLAPTSHFAQVLSLLEQATHPLIIIGGGVRYSQAGAVVEQFASEHHIPIAYTQAGKSAVASSYKLNLGGIGVTGTYGANAYAAQADLVLGIGTKYSDFTTGSKEIFQQHPHFININVNDFDALKMRGLSLVGDAWTVVLQLQEYLQRHNFKKQFSCAQATCLQVQTTWNEMKQALAQLDKTAFLSAPLVEDDNRNQIELFETSVDQHYKQAIPIFIQAAVVLLINKILADQVVVGAAGSLPGDLQRLWETDKIDSYNVEYGYSCMGHEIQAAIGASLALNKRPVYAFCGDGSFLMLHSELHTAVQQKIPVVVLLFDNSGFGCINNLQSSYQIKNFETMFHHSNSNEMVITDYAKIAAGYGVKSYLIHSLVELETLLIESKTSKEPMLIEIKVYPKSMTSGYLADWQCGICQNAYDPQVRTKAKASQELFGVKRHFN